MTTTEFQSRFPKPWRLVIFKTTFSLRAANGEILASMPLGSYHEGIPQIEWNRHVAAGLAEYLPVDDATPADERRPRFTAKWR